MESVLPNIKDCCTAQQLEILDGEQWYKQSGRLKPTHRLLAAWIEKLEDALRSGFAGLRVTGSAAIIEHRDWGKFNEYDHHEQRDTRATNESTLLVFVAELPISDVLDAFNTHHSAVIKKTWGVDENRE